MGTYYGAPQLTATTLAASGQGTVAPMKVTSAPLAPGLEWRLVTVSGTIDDVQRDGESWRAELKIGTSTVPIVGIDRSGIPSTALIEGREATVVGIVKRAYPTSTDQRLAVVPRTVQDISLGSPGASPRPGPGGSTRPGPSGLTSSGRPAPRSSAGTTTGSTTGSQGGVPGASSDNGAPGSDGSVALFSVISALDQHVGETVRVGGRVVSVVPSADAATEASITLDDGTGQATVRLTGTAAALIDQLSTGDLVNVVGTVAMTAAGSVEITVEDASKVARIPAPASLAAASALATTIGVDGQLPPAIGDESPTPSSASPSPLLLVAGLLALIGLTLGGLAAAGPQRRARFVAALVTASATLRARIARAPQASDQG